MSLRPTWATYEVPGQPELHKEIVLKTICMHIDINYIYRER